MRKNKISKFLSIFIVVCIIFLLMKNIILLFEPVFLNKAVKGKNNLTGDETINSMAALYNYFDLYKEKKYEDINKALTYANSKEDNVYKQYASDISLYEKEDIQINEISKKGRNKYIINYSIKDKIENILVIRIDENQKTYDVYFDELLESY